MLYLIVVTDYQMNPVQRGGKWSGHKKLRALCYQEY